MTAVRATCPNCGAPIEFRWAQAVQATCAYCQSVLVRHDVDLEKIGTTAIPPLTPSPLILGAEGRYEGVGFVVVGRLAYRWSGGAWSEWHLRMDDGTSAWLSDAQADYVFTRPVTPSRALPYQHELRVGGTIGLEGTIYRVTSITEATYLGTEGELPFRYAPIGMVPFADLRGEDGSFATIDYTEEPPLLFRGEPVELRQLELRNLRTFEGW